MKFPFYLFLIISLFLNSCANIVSPTGGEKDNSPPQLVKTFPEDFNSNFRSGEILFLFDEVIDVNNWDENFYMSPFCSQKISFLVKDKELVLKIKEDLKENTSYNITLDNCVKDITEGNVISKLDYTFSTSSFLDTLKFNGKVLDSYTLNPENNIWVLLYDSNVVDSLIFNTSPIYITKTDSLGGFLFKNLNLKKYIVVALSGNDLKYDDGEKIAFIKKDIITHSNTYETLLLFEPPITLSDSIATKENLIIDSLNNSPDVLGGSLIFRSPLKESLIVQFLKNNDVVLEHNSNDSIVFIQNISPGEYNLKLIVDSNKNKKWDTGNFKTKLLPEKVINYPEKITVRSNWDLEITWTNIIAN